MGKTFLLAAATAVALAFGATSANADTISNPTNNYPFFGPLCAGGIGGNCQSQMFGESFTASITGELTNFQFTLNSTSLTKLFAQVYTWNGTTPGDLLWSSSVLSNPTGLLSFDPTGVQLTQGVQYVALLSTYGLSGNSGSAYVGACIANCASSIPNLGTTVQGYVYGDGTLEWRHGLGNDTQDLTFSATIAPVPEAATWAMMLAGFGLLGATMRRRRVAVSFA